MVEAGIKMAVKTPAKAVAALTALKALQEDAKRKGLDKMTMEDIDTEIAAYRRDRRGTVKSDPKSPVDGSSRSRH
jgi:hypothetical protein